MKAARIKILEPSLQHYTGTLCGAEFREGISVQALSFLEQQRICAVMRAQTVDGDNVSPSGQLAAAYNKTAEEARKEEKSAAPLENLPRAEKVNAPAHPVFTREELEAVADAEGIAGLRSIGEAVGARGKTINALIDAIVKAQGGAK